ncbi:response regulator transcription factor [Neptunomonas sp.]|uniref:response regulator transcription factor n=1 Tax=Neptunomonas sp. TaxID=1971898 RepID=UPI0025DA1D34|nr:response regulator transcription factor [Neptunomonas sp.]
MSAHKLIYITDDERDICDIVSRELQAYGFNVETFLTGSELKQALQLKSPDLCIVDLGLPDMDGIELVKSLCEQANMGVMILSGRDSVTDRVLGLELGADDYIVKPFIPRELVARVNSLFRRFKKNNHEQQSTSLKVAQFAGWRYDPSTLTLSGVLSCDIQEGESEEIGQELSAAEHELLMLLLHSPRKIMSRDKLLGERISPFDRSIDVRMSRVRKKIENNPKQPTLIKTVYGVGYILTADVEWV